VLSALMSCFETIIAYFVANSQMCEDGIQSVEKHVQHQHIPSFARVWCSACWSSFQVVCLKTCEI